MIKFQFFIDIMFNLYLLRLSLKLSEMIMHISLVCTLTQNRMGDGKVTFPSVGLRKGKYVFFFDKSKIFHIYIHLLFLEVSHLISLKCACLAVWNVHVLCLKQECELGSVMLPNIGPLRDQCVFVTLNFLCVRFSIFS